MLRKQDPFDSTNYDSLNVYFLASAELALLIEMVIRN